MLYEKELILWNFLFDGLKFRFSLLFWMIQLEQKEK